MIISQLTKKFSMSIAGTAIVASDGITTTTNVVLENENVLNNNTNGEEREPDSNDILVVTEVNSNSSDIGEEITLPSGSLLTVNSDSKYSYNPNDEYNSIEILLWMQLL
ncbi:hypothetical protein ACP6PL_14885 [Dapis sp. BLCC M126]|uniref:hypothetical protein n=1 Tax=Dapis sp. BLCC M126 TaxID=3400189 RepID=UPI003CE9CFE9